jgi:hypothetical protein
MQTFSMPVTLPRPDCRFIAPSDLHEHDELITIVYISTDGNSRAQRLFYSYIYMVIMSKTR